MYLEFYRLTEKPFNITPNPRFIFLSKTHREVFAHLLYGIRNHAGFIEVTGEVGTGKTTVLRTIFGQLGGDAYRLAFIFNPSLSAAELLRAVNREYGLMCEGLSAGELLDHLYTFLLNENRAGRTVVLVIDEAQNLVPSVLEQIRLISNLETESDKLIQIVLVGQPELGALLSRSELRQLSQRITVRYHLKALDFEDTCAYVEHRLGVAGWQGGKLFTLESLRLIYQHSRGVPRLINVLCDRALLVAYGEEKREISTALVAQAVRELRRAGAGELPVWRRFWPVAVALLLTAGVVLWRVAAVEMTPAATVATPTPIASAPRVVNLPESRDPATALAPLLARWQVAPAASGASITLPDGLAALATERSLGVLRLRGSLAALLLLDTPALLNLSGSDVPLYVALTGRRGSMLRLELAGGVQVEVPQQLLAERFSGEAYLFWRNPLEISTRDGAWRAAAPQRRLQELLAACGFAIPNGEGIQTTLRTFQQQKGLAVDGVPGPQTLLALYQTAGSYGLPRLTVAAKVQP
jgi:general secretion pathway protein A